MKPYLVFMGGPNSLQDIEELVTPIKPYIRGICALLHDCNEFSPEATYLLKVNNELGGGNIIFGAYVGDHSHSRNRILKETGLKQGDLVVSLDLLERIPVEFAQQFESLFTQMAEKSIDVANFFSKPYLIRYREDIIYLGTPHENLIAHNIFGTQLSKIELNQCFADENKVRINMRPIKRDKNSHVSHYIRYWLMPNSNQNLLGLEHRGYDKLARYEELRLNLIKELGAKNLPRTVDGVKELLSRGLNEVTRPIVNEVGWMNNFYRYYILNQEVEDTHFWQNLPQF